MNNNRNQIAVAFGQALRQVRRKAGISQEAMAKAAKMDRTYPSLLERGLRTPTLGVFMDLAPVCQVTPQILLRVFIEKLATRS